MKCSVGAKIGWSAALAGAAAAAVWGVRDYARWRALGPGGLPANVRGWIAMCRYRLMAQDGLDAGPLAAAIGSAGDLQGWTHVRPRLGTCPSVSPYPVPHRQLDQLPAEAVRVELARLFDRAVLEHAGKVSYALSHFEKRHPAITRTQPSGAESHGEIAHIHPSDHSMHMILSPTDAVAAIRMGWAQRHGLAGIAVGLPDTYVMIYAPRDERDLDVVAELLEAAIAFATQPAGRSDR